MDFVSLFLPKTRIFYYVLVISLSVVTTDSKIEFISLIIFIKCENTVRQEKNCLFKRIFSRFMIIFLQFLIVTSKMKFLHVRLSNKSTILYFVDKVRETESPESKVLNSTIFVDWRSSQRGIYSRRNLLQEYVYRYFCNIWNSLNLSNRVPFFPKNCA